MKRPLVQVYWPGVLRRYAEQPERFHLEDTAIDGHISTSDQFYFSLPARERASETVRLRYDKRNLADNRVVLMPWPPDFERLPPKHRLHWSSWIVKNPTLADLDKDPDFQQAIQQNIYGQFIEPSDDPIFEVSEGLRLVNQVERMFRHEENPYLHYPQLDNDKHYSACHKELWKLLGPDNLDVQKIKSLLKSVGADFTNDDKPWALLKKLLAKLTDDGRPDILGPFERVSKERSPDAHEIRAFALTHQDYVERFKGDCRDVAAALRELAKLLSEDRSLGSNERPHAWSQR